MAARIVQAWAERKEIPYKSLLLPQAIEASTRENRREHYTRRWLDVRARIQSG